MATNAIPKESKAYKIQLSPTPATTSSHTDLATLVNNLQLVTVSTPTPPKGSVLVKIAAVALNFRDLLIITDSPLYPSRTTSGLVPFSDGSGTVVSTGEDSIWKTGDKVIVAANESWLQGDVPADFNMHTVLGGGGLDGLAKQYAVVRDEYLIRAPANMTLEEAAALPMAGGTAVSGLFHGPNLNAMGGKGIRAGEWVLTQGTGGVSCFAIQLAAVAGAKVIATSSSDEKLEAAKKLGAKYLINYKTTTNWADKVLALTGGKGVDHVIEVGGAGTIEQSLKALRQGGVAHVIGILTPSQQADLVPALLFGAKIARGCLGFSRAMIKECVEMMEAHDLHPAIAESFPWEDLEKAFGAMLKGDGVGKIVLRIP